MQHCIYIDTAAQYSPHLRNIGCQSPCTSMYCAPHPLCLSELSLSGGAVHHNTGIHYPYMPAQCGMGMRHAQPVVMPGPYSGMEQSRLGYPLPTVLDSGIPLKGLPGAFMGTVRSLFNGSRQKVAVENGSAGSNTQPENRYRPIYLAGTNGGGFKDKVTPNELSDIIDAEVWYVMRKLQLCEKYLKYPLNVEQRHEIKSEWDEMLARVRWHFSLLKSFFLTQQKTPEAALQGQEEFIEEYKKKEKPINKLSIREFNVRKFDIGQWIENQEASIATLTNKLLQYMKNDQTDPKISLDTSERTACRDGFDDGSIRRKIGNDRPWVNIK